MYVAYRTAYALHTFSYMIPKQKCELALTEQELMTVCSVGDATGSADAPATALLIAL